MDSKDIDRPYLAKLAGNLRGPNGNALLAFAAVTIESLVKVIDDLQADAIRDPKIEELEAEVSRLTVERYRVCASLGIAEDGDVAARLAEIEDLRALAPIANDLAAERRRTCEALGIAETDDPVEAIGVLKGDVDCGGDFWAEVREVVGAGPGQDAAEAARALVSERDALAAERDRLGQERDALKEGLDAANERRLEFQREAASLRVECDALFGHVRAWRKWAADILPWVLGETDEQHRGRLSDERDALRAEVERLKRDATVARERLTVAGVRLCDTLAEAVAIAIKDRDNGWDEAERERARVAELEAEVSRLQRACEDKSESYRQQSELLDRHMAEKHRLREAAGIMMFGNPDIGVTAVAEAIEAENDAEALAGPAFDALAGDDVEAAKMVLAQMEGDDRLRGTQAYTRLSTMVSMEMTVVDDSDSEALVEITRQVAEDVEIGEGEPVADALKRARAKAAEREWQCREALAAWRDWSSAIILDESIDCSEASDADLRRAIGAEIDKARNLSIDLLAKLRASAKHLGVEMGASEAWIEYMEAAARAGFAAGFRIGGDSRPVTLDDITAWRKWAAEMAGIDEGEVQALDDDSLRTGVATRRRAWMDAADGRRHAEAQRDFYRARLHAEIEAHSLRSAKEKP